MGCRGHPRTVNNLALQALVAAFVDGKGMVDESAVRVAITEVADDQIRPCLMLVDLYVVGLVLVVGSGRGHDVAMPQPVAGRVELWDGWSIELPSGCMSERNPDGSWSAWDAARVVDIHIVTVGGTQTGRPMTAEQMLGQPGELRGPGWIATRQLLEDRDDQGRLLRVAVTLAADNTLLSCWVSFRQDTDVAWADQVWQSARHRS